MSHLLFSFGTLQLESVQQSLYGRIVPMEPDVLTGYRVARLHITDPAVIEASGSDIHPALVEDSDGTVEGKVLVLDDAELQATDRYESVGYYRATASLESGREAIIYLPRDVAAVLD